MTKALLKAGAFQQLDEGQLEELLDDTIKLLDLPDGSDPAAIHAKLRKVAEDFQCERLLLGIGGSAKAQRLAIRKLRRQIEDVLIAIGDIAPEFTAALEMLIPKPNGTEPVTIAVTKMLLSLHDAAGLFDENYKPTKGAPGDYAAEEAVRALISIIADATDNTARPRMNKAKGTSPEMIQSEARAIGHLMRGLDPLLTETTVANLMSKAGTSANPVEHPFDALIRLHPELDLSLLPNRHQMDRRRST